MTVITRNSTLAVVPESTEGSATAPTAATQYVALQDDAVMSGGQETLENAELRSSIAPGQPIPGLKNPTFSMSHYLRHSHVEGTSPDFSNLLKSAFGNETVAGTEYDTVAGWTTTGGDVDVGEGTNFQRGQFLLFKKTTGVGYEIRPIHGVSGDSLDLGFSLSDAPGTGINLGKCCLFHPASTDHITNSIWHYVGGTGARQLMTGARTVGVGVTIDAAQLINANYTLEGIDYYFNPIEVTSSDNKLDFDDGGGEENVSVSAGFYRPEELASAIQTAMDAATTDNITVTYSNSTGKFTIASDGGTLSLLWNTGSQTAETIAALIGFDDSANDTGALSYTSDDPQSYASPQTPSYDSGAVPLAAKNHQLFIGDQTDNVCINASTIAFNLANTKADILSICAASGKSGSIITERGDTVTLTAPLNKYDQDFFQRMEAGTTTRFMYVGGAKSGGNWIPGRNIGIYLPLCTVTSVEVSDTDGRATLDLSLTAYDDGNGEVFMGFV